MQLCVICSWRCCVKQPLKWWLSKRPSWFTNYRHMKYWYTHTSDSAGLTGIFSHTVNTSKPLWLAHTPELRLCFFLHLFCSPYQSKSRYLASPARICISAPSSQCDRDRVKYSLTAIKHNLTWAHPVSTVWCETTSLVSA